MPELRKLVPAHFSSLTSAFPSALRLPPSPFPTATPGPGIGKPVHLSQVDGPFSPASFIPNVPCYLWISMSTADKLYDEAIELQQAGKLEESVGKLCDLVAAHPDYALGYAGLSAFYSRLGKHDEAVANGRKVCELDPDDPFSFMALSLVCQRAGQIQEAEQAMADAMHKQWSAQREG
jgi:tetratricopeptide (TPR) repeat protein